VAKGLWREELTYAKHMLDQVLRDQLMKMLTWHIGVKTHFSRDPGYLGKYFKKFLEAELWNMLERTYSNADYDMTWEALFTMCALFRKAACLLAEQFGFEYPFDHDKRVSDHLEHVRFLPKNAKTMY